MKISAKTKFSIIIGDPVNHSLSPKMHNAAYKQLGIDDQFVYLGSNVKITDVRQVVESMRVMDNFRGLTCTIPHKIEVMKYLDWIDPVAWKIGAVNSVVNDEGVLKGYNTDWLGVTIPLLEATSVKNKKVALIGAGGAARAIVYGLKSKGAKVTIFNRTLDAALKLAEEFDCLGISLDDQSDIKTADIVINATVVGMKPMDNKTPIDPSNLNGNQVVFDIVYAPFETVLLKEARKKGAKIIHGVEMLLHQGTAQFELYCHHKAPVEVMRKVLYGKS